MKKISKNILILLFSIVSTSLADNGVLSSGTNQSQNSGVLVSSSNQPQTIGQVVAQQVIERLEKFLEIGDSALFPIRC